MDKIKEFVAYQSAPSVVQILVMKEYTDVSVTLMMMRMRIAEQKKLKPIPTSKQPSSRKGNDK
jgi:hypothetical protein